MKFILPNCRERFTPADIQFITRTLSKSPRQAEALWRLLGEADERDRILDEEMLVCALRDSPACGEVSVHCYFYLLVRHVLRRAGIEDRPLADYVAGILAGYVRTEDGAVPADTEGRPLRYVFEMLAALQKADERMRFYLQAHLGNHTLFVTGLFPEHLQYRTARRGAPGIDYYEGMGRSSFKAAADHRLAERYELDRILAELAEVFREVRLALNDLAERMAWVGQASPGI